MVDDVLQLTQDLVAIESPSQRSNAAIADKVAGILERGGFQVERLAFDDANGQRKVSLVARKGRGQGGLGYFCHSDTVPGGDGWQPFTPVVQEGRLIGRGSADMKGALAAVLLAGGAVDAADLRRPLTVVVTADEEVGYPGARQVIAESALLAAFWPEMGVVTEPTCLQPVYAHKGGARIKVTAYGRAAHTSTDHGFSANFRIAPFLAEMAELAQLFRRDERFMNHEFDPPTNGFNMVIDDGGCASNVYAAKTVCTLSIRYMPNDHREEALARIFERARAHGLAVDHFDFDPFYIAPDAPVVQAALSATGAPRAVTVSYGTEASLFGQFVPLVVLGPGDIAQAHTVGEWIDVGELRSAQAVYASLIRRVCTD
jgi:acetylornithine deacetylase